MSNKGKHRSVKSMCVHQQIKRPRVYMSSITTDNGLFGGGRITRPTITLAQRVDEFIDDTRLGLYLPDDWGRRRTDQPPEGIAASIRSGIDRRVPLSVLNMGGVRPCNVKAPFWTLRDC